MSNTFAFDGRSGSISSLRISPANSHLITIDSEGIGRVWNLQQPSPKHVILSTKVDPIREAVFSPDGKVIMTGSVDGTIRSVDLDIELLTTRARGAIGRNLSRFEWCQAMSPLPYQVTFDDLPEWRTSENVNCITTGASRPAGIAATLRGWLFHAQAATTASVAR